MSRKRKAPVRKVYPDPKFHSEVVSKFINSIMYDGKRSTAEKILYDALDKIKSKNNEDPLKVFNTAIGNVKPNLECRSRRVGGATYQVPVEVKAKRAQALALRWIMDATRKRKSEYTSFPGAFLVRSSGRRRVREPEARATRGGEAARDGARGDFSLKKMG